MSSVHVKTVRTLFSIPIGDLPAVRRKKGHDLFVIGWHAWDCRFSDAQSLSVAQLVVDTIAVYREESEGAR